MSDIEIPFAKDVHTTLNNIKNNLFLNSISQIKGLENTYSTLNIISHKARPLLLHRQNNAILFNDT